MFKLARQVLLIAWPSADWETVSSQIDAGTLPHLRQMVECGVVGVPANEGGFPYASIITGCHPDGHGILSSLECDPRTGQLRPPLSSSLRRKSLWAILGESYLRSLVVAWPVLYPIEPFPGVAVASEAFDSMCVPGVPWAPPPGTVFPVSYAPRAVELCLNPTELTAAAIGPFLPDFAAIDQARDPTVRNLAFQLSRVASLHAITTSLMETESWDFLAVAYNLIEFAGLTNQRLTEHLQQHLLDSCYRFTDMMLGRLLQLGGDGALVIVVSAGRAGKPGFLCLAGPQAKADQLLHGASFLDVAPTVLYVLGCAVPDQMQGRPLTTAFDDPPAVRLTTAKIDWLVEDDPFEAASWIASLEQLGYRDPQQSVCLKNRARVERESALHGTALRVLDDSARAGR